MDFLYQTVTEALINVFGRAPGLSELILILMLPLFVSAFLLEWIHVRYRSGNWPHSQRVIGCS